MKRTAVYIAAAALLVSCASAGTPNATQNIAKIKKSITTEADLVRMFGSPSNKTLNSNGNVVMSWVHSAAQPKTTSFVPFAGPFIGRKNVQVQHLIVLMGKDGTVEITR